MKLGILRFAEVNLTMPPQEGIMMPDTFLKKEYLLKQCQSGLKME